MTKLDDHRDFFLNHRLSTLADLLGIAVTTIPPAVFKKRLEEVRDFLDFVLGAELCHNDTDNSTPLYWAIRRDEHNANERVTPHLPDVVEEVVVLLAGFHPETGVRLTWDDDDQKRGVVIVDKDGDDWCYRYPGHDGGQDDLSIYDHTSSDYDSEEEIARTQHRQSVMKMIDAEYRDSDIYVDASP